MLRYLSARILRTTCTNASLKYKFKRCCIAHLENFHPFVRLSLSPFKPFARSRNCNRVQFYQGFYQASRPEFEIKVTQIFITKRECKTVRENKVRINEMKIFFQRKRFWLKLSQESSIKLCIFLQHSVWIVDLKIEEFVFKKIESQLWKIIILKRNLYY